MIFCDFTIDAPYELSDEEIKDQTQQEQYLIDFQKDQEKVVEKLKAALESKEPMPQEELDKIYDVILEYDQQAYQIMLQARADERKKDGEKGWSVWSYIKKFYGIVMMLGLLKMLLFPGALPELTPTIKDPTNMRDLAKLNLNQSEMDQIFSSPTVEDKRLTISKIVS